MGNHFSVDVDEEFLKGMLYSNKPIDYGSWHESEEIKVREIKLQNIYLYYFKMTIIDYRTRQDLRDRLRSHLIKEILIKELNFDFTQENMNIHLTGNGIEMHSDLISFITETRLGLVNPIINKHRSIDRIYSAVNYLLDAKYPFLYQISPPSILEVTKLTPEDKFQKEFLNFEEKDLEFPLLFINLKSGVSYYKVSEKGGKLEKTIGSVFGEATLSGLCRLVCKDYTERPSKLIDQSFSTGKSTKVDLTVGDIYGESYGEIGLDSNLVASSLGKPQSKLEGVTDNDYYRSFISMLAINLSNIAALVAKINQVKSVI